MPATLVDANVLLDVATEDEQWVDWSAGRLADAGQRGALVINPIIYAEVSVRFETIEALDEALPPEFYTRAPVPASDVILEDVQRTEAQRTAPRCLDVPVERRHGGARIRTLRTEKKVRRASAAQYDGDAT